MKFVKSSECKWLTGKHGMDYSKRVLLDDVPKTINLVQDVIVPAGGFVPPHAHGHAEVFYAVSGEVTMIVDGKELELSPGDTVVVDVREEHSFKNTGANEFRMLVLKANFTPDEAILRED